MAIETDDEGFGLWCGNCHCADCVASRLEVAEEQRVREWNRAHPIHGPLTALEQAMRDSAARMWEAMLNPVVDPNCKSGVAYVLQLPPT